MTFIRTSTNSAWEILPSWFSSISLNAVKRQWSWKYTCVHSMLLCFIQWKVHSPVFTRTSWLALSAFVSLIRRKRSRTIFWSSYIKKVKSLYNTLFLLAHLKRDGSVIIDVKNAENLFQVFLWSAIWHDVEDYHELSKIYVTILKWVLLETGLLRLTVILNGLFFLYFCPLSRGSGPWLTLLESYILKMCLSSFSVSAPG